ncbi:MAG TPA: hypothetical protein VN408_31575 [Actinoplanes sp.]|nr:hypothetical protein [Actinoplanes sp.]
MTVAPRVASRAVWWWPHTEFVVFSERPTVLRMEAGQLRSVVGPGAEWSDGFQIHATRSARHGVISA